MNQKIFIQVKSTHQPSSQSLVKRKSKTVAMKMMNRTQKALAAHQIAMKQVNQNLASIMNNINTSRI